MDDAEEEAPAAEAPADVRPAEFFVRALGIRKDEKEILVGGITTDFISLWLSG